MGNIINTISLTQKYMVIEILLCGLGSLVFEGHFLFPKARAPRTPRFIYATQDSKHTYDHNPRRWVHLVIHCFTMIICLKIILNK